MLVVDIYINRIDCIHEIMVQRVGGNVGELCRYMIVKPIGFENEIIEHHYNDGVLSLVKKVLDVILNEK